MREKCTIVVVAEDTFSSLPSSPLWSSQANHFVQAARDMAFCIF